MTIESKEDDWGTVKVSGQSKEDEVEFEIEGEIEQEDVKQKANTKPKKDETLEEDSQTQTPEELEGIQTKGAEKRIRQLIKQRKDREDRIRDLELRLVQYEEDRRAKEEESRQTRMTALEQTEESLKEQIETTSAVLKKALESGETDEVIDAQKKLYRAEISLSKLTDAKQNFEEAPKKVPQKREEGTGKTIRVANQTIDPAQIDIKAYQWVQNNEEWFNKDMVMTAAALAIDAQLRNEGFDPSDDEFYEEVDGRMKSSFPQKFKGIKEQDKPESESPKKTHQVVGGGSRTSSSQASGKSSNKVKLTQIDIKNAEKWGISLERYAAQKLATQQAGEGEYTTIVTSKRGG